MLRLKVTFASLLLLVVFVEQAFDVRSKLKQKISSSSYLYFVVVVVVVVVLSKIPFLFGLQMQLDHEDELQL